jgi:polyferredoxin
LVGIPIFLAALVVWCRGKTVQVVPPSILPSRAKLIWVMILIGIPAIFFAKVLWNLQYAGSVRSVFVVLYYGVTQAGALLMIATLFLGMHHLVLLRMKK